jgi:hypothetical protein
MIIFVILLFIAAVISIAWASGIHEMKEKHPDYKGEDFLNEDGNSWISEEPANDAILQEHKISEK